MDLPSYQSIVDRPIANKQPRVAMIGAGLAGLFAARALSDHGIAVTVFDKSRGVSGRMATRRANEDLSFDHGAQYFTARDHRFRRYVDSWIHDGTVARWDGRLVELGDAGQIVAEKGGVDRYVGVPGMKQIGKHLASDLDLQLGQRVETLSRVGAQWRLHLQDDQTSDLFDAVIANCPPPQAHTLLQEHSSIAKQIATVNMRPCWAMMIVCEQLDSLQFDGAFINDGPLSWIARDSSKPGRNNTGHSSWVIHASADWSREFVDAEPDAAQELMIAALEAAIGRKLDTISHCVVHRWLYAIPENPLETDCLWDKTEMLGACGDWCGGPRVEGAFLSGMAMAGTLLRQVTIDRTPHQGPAKMVQPSLL